MAVCGACELVLWAGERGELGGQIVWHEALRELVRLAIWQPAAGSYRDCASYCTGIVVYAAELAECSDILALPAPSIPGGTGRLGLTCQVGQGCKISGLLSSRALHTWIFA